MSLPSITQSQHQGNVELFETSLRSPEPIWELRGIVRALLAQGYDRQTLVDEITQLKNKLGDAGREADWEVLYELLGFFDGWCHPSLKL